MGRSVKKGPYVQPVLLKRVEEMNKSGEKRVLKTWSRSHSQKKMPELQKMLQKLAK